MNNHRFLKLIVVDCDECGTGLEHHTNLSLLYHKTQVYAIVFGKKNDVLQQVDSIIKSTPSSSKRNALLKLKGFLVRVTGNLEKVLEKVAEDIAVRKLVELKVLGNTVTGNEEARDHEMI